MRLNKSSHFNALSVLAFTNAWDTFSYFGTQTILALYLMRIFQLSQHTSYLFYGAYAAFTFGLPIFGGMIGDRWFGSRLSVVWGSVLNIVGNLMMMSLQFPLFCLGIGMTLVGTGLCKSNSLQLVGSLYPDEAPNKEQGFIWVYIAINVGGMLAPLAYGFIAYKLGWNYIFGLSAMGLTLSLLAFIAKWRTWPSEHAALSGAKKIIPAIMVILSIILITAAFYFTRFSTWFLPVFFIFAIGFFISIILKEGGTYKQRLSGLLLLCSFALFYFVAGLQIGTTITLFIQHKIHQGFIKTHLPASIFSTLYCAFVLFLSPFVAAVWKKAAAMKKSISPIFKVNLGIILGGAGIAVFALAALTNWIIPSVLIGIMLLSAGELVLMPTIYTTISNKSPHHLRSTFMGCWYLFVAMGGYLSSVLAAGAHWLAATSVINNSPFFKEFGYISGFTLMIALIMFIVTPKLKTMLSDG